ncbi:hypothetical protein syc1976_d [Synechococcus elongatus PCC 6301]|uniref:Serine aminopeptidase S33 domain-containing protein n=1 Tax=Synechococcus sp. (strain ATCC 27144 / PCC 6301 / SAUG 1402/1) TaxID=269084 RepID=A0A0H3K4H9_SYNP6|nr:alpha/beta fold hydrolase [Synechococcus elongatus]BAD80166.1 hypothetical protein syc1976_d [Synechococcus elongatus PCC 6301]
MLLRSLLLILLGCGSVVLLFLAAIWLGQSRLIFRPAKDEPIPESLLAYQPAEVWIALQPQAVRSPRLQAWWFPNQGVTPWTVLYLHGIQGRWVDTEDRLLQLLSLGLSVLVLQYRGYGRSSGPFPNEQRVCADAEAAVAYLAKEHAIPSDRLLVYGHSLGGAIAAELANRQPKLAGLILEGSFSSMRAMTQYRQRFAWFPNWLLHQRFDTLAKVRQSSVPVLILHGEADTEVPALMSEALFLAAAGPKQLCRIPDGGHNDLPKLAGDRYRQAFQRFLDLVAARSRA